MEKQEVKISIIVPFHNGQAFMARFLATFKAQTYQNFELIMVDDGSTDASVQILEAERGSLKLKLFRIGNHGVSHGRNVGLQQASGDIIGFCDIDDLVHPRLLEIVQQVHQASHQVTVVHAQVIKANEVGAFLNKDNEHVIVKDWNRATLFTQMNFNDREIFGSVWNKFFSASVLKGYIFNEDLTLYEDANFIYQVVASQANLVIKEVPLALYGYYYNENSVTISENPDWLYTAAGELRYAQAIQDILRQQESNLTTKQVKQLQAKLFRLALYPLYRRNYPSKVAFIQLKKLCRRYFGTYLVWYQEDAFQKFKKSLQFLLVMLRRK